MRLTLRTLLAYLDDTLEPAQAKLIGQKVAESDAAQELIARIKQVTRRRRLTTPPEAGNGAATDPNTVAAYLDNALPSEQLAEVEEASLASDVHLAEIAACHQILTLVLGEPALVPPTARQRMYGLVKGREAIPFRKPPVAADAAEAEEAQEVDETLRLGLPAYRRRGGWNQPWTILVGGLVLAGLLAVAVWQLLPNPRPATEEGGEGGGSRQVAVVNPNTNPPPRRDNRDRPVPPTDKQPSDKAAADKRVKDREVVKDEEPKDRTSAAKDQGKPKKDKATAKDKKTKKDRNELTSSDKPIIEPPIQAGNPRAVGEYVAPGRNDRPSVLLHRAKGGEKWERLVKGSADVFTGDNLVSLPGYQSDVQLTNGMRLQLLGDLPELTPYTPVLESKVLLNEPGDADLDLTLEEGRILIENTRKDKPALARVRFDDPTANSGRAAWEVTLPAGSKVALQLWGRYPPEVPFSTDKKKRLGPQAELALLVVKGQPEVKTGDTTYGMEAPPARPAAAGEGASSGPSLVRWSSRGGNQPPENIPGLPPWALGKLPLFRQDLPKQARDYYERLRSEMLKAMFELAGSLKPDRIETSLTNQLKQENPIKRILVVHCFGAIGDLENLLDLLTDKQYSDVRQAAVETLRHWIGLKKDNDLVLYNFLLRDKRYTTEEATAFMRLLHSFSDRERADPGTYALLIDYLRQDEWPALRVLAYWHLVRLAPEGARIPYDPMGQSDQYQHGADLWKKLIPEGKLPPGLQQPPPKGKGK